MQTQILVMIGANRDPFDVYIDENGSVSGCDVRWGNMMPYDDLAAASTEAVRIAEECWNYPHNKETTMWVCGRLKRVRYSPCLGHNLILGMWDVENNRFCRKYLDELVARAIWPVLEELSTQAYCEDMWAEDSGYALQEWYDTGIWPVGGYLGGDAETGPMWIGDPPDDDGKVRRAYGFICNIEEAQYCGRMQYNKRP